MIRLKGEEKKRAAAPLPKASGRQALPVPELKTQSQVDAVPKKGPGRPPGPARVAILVKVPPKMVGRLERTQAKRKLPTRNEAIVVLLDEGAEK